MNRVARFLLVLVALAGNCAAVAQAEGLHHITGFRSAHFGMDEKQVRAAIRKDFSLSGEDITRIVNEEQATTLLRIVLPTLSPGPGDAHVYYILGATSGKLSHINVVWATSDTPTQEERNHIAVAGMQLARYFADKQWKPEGAVTGVTREPGEVLTFAGVDPDDAGVEVIASGVSTTNASGETTTPEGPAVLTVRYAQRYGHADAVTVEGAF